MEICMIRKSTLFTKTLCGTRKCFWKNAKRTYSTGSATNCTQVAVTAVTAIFCSAYHCCINITVSQQSVCTSVFVSQRWKAHVMYKTHVIYKNDETWQPYTVHVSSRKRPRLHVARRAQQRVTVSLFEIGEIGIIQRSRLSRWLLLHSQEHVYSYLAIQGANCCQVIRLQFAQLTPQVPYFRGGFCAWMSLGQTPLRLW